MRHAIVIFAAVAMGGCMMETTDSEEAAVGSACGSAQVFECSPDDGLDTGDGHDGPTEVISSCALCRRVEDAFDARSAELGCCADFPLDTCPLGEVDGCFAWQADDHANFIRNSADCDVLLARIEHLPNWSGFECGGPYCFAPPHFDYNAHGDRPDYCPPK